MNLKTALLVLAATLTPAIASTAAAASADAQALKAIQLDNKHGPNAKLGPALNALVKARSSSSSRSPGLADRASRLEKLLLASDGSIRVDISVKGSGASERAALESYGLSDTATFKNYISGRVPITALPSIAQLGSVIAIRPVLSKTNAGLTTTQGDKAQRSDIARSAYSLTGAGITVGLMSNSYSCLTAPFNPDPQANFTTASEDKANGDLPKNPRIIKDLPKDQCASQGTDEGRAMMQLVHDVAPGSSLQFRTASTSQTDFALGILQLAAAGSNVIADDVLFYAEPMFQDGIVAQAVDAVRAQGVTYFSSAGNEARQSYQSAFRRSNDVGLSGIRHNFKGPAGTDTLQRIALDPDTITLLVFQWDEPFASVSVGTGSRSDLDLIFYKNNGDPVTPCDDNLEPAVCQIPGVDGNEGGDPIELALIVNTGTTKANVNLAIELYSGPAPHQMKYVWFDQDLGFFTPAEYDTQSGPSYGHANSAGAEAVGAAAWYNTKAWGSPLWGAPCIPACTEVFSSAGGTPILFDTVGNRLKNPVIRLKPGITAPDGGNTSFFYTRFTDTGAGGGEPDEFPNFFGTSAAAPHAGAVAALMLQQLHRNGGSNSTSYLDSKAVPSFVIDTLRNTATDIQYRAGRITPPYSIKNGYGFDRDSGFGIVNATKALDAVRASGLATR